MIEEQIRAIEARNRRVELEKAWETSLTRRGFICIITYVCACIIMKYIIQSPDWAFGAIVPVMGYALSTLSLPWIRKAWEKIYRGDNL